MFRAFNATSFIGSSLILLVALANSAATHADSSDSERPSRKGLDQQQLRVVDSMEELRLEYELQEKEVTRACGARMTDAALYELRDIVTLTTVYAACHSDVTNFGLQCLENLPNIETLSVRGEQINNEGIQSLAKLTKLKKLIIVQASIDDDCLATIAQLKNLETVYFTRTNVSPNAALILRDTLPDCTVKIYPRK